MDMNDILAQWDKMQADRIKKQKENGPKNPERRDYVWNMLHPSRFFFPCWIVNDQRTSI